jgi:uncharacterized phage-associated protein
VQQLVASVDDVAAAILEETGTVTTRKLQKLVYYAQAWHLVFEGEPLFSNRIEAWRHGPVTRDLYNRHRSLYTVDRWDGDPRALAESERRTVDWVLAKYGSFTAEALSRMTHMEVPWLVARGLAEEHEHTATPIDHNQMISYYSRQRSDPDVAVSQAAASAAMEGAQFDDAWQETLRTVATGEASADEVIAAEIRRFQSGV